MKYFKWIYVSVFYVEIYDNTISYILYENNVLTIEIFLRYDNNVMRNWNMLKVVKHRESVAVEPN